MSARVIAIRPGVILCAQSVNEWRIMEYPVKAKDN